MKNCLLILAVAILGISACKKEPYVDYRAIALKQYGTDTVIINKFIVDNNIPVVKDSTIDVYYQIIDPGAGDEIVWTANSEVTANYTGKLLDGTVFDQNNSFVFKLGEVIAGWQIGIQKIKKGGVIRLIIPSGFGYGDRASGKIPANSILDFNIELKEVN